MHVQEGEKVEGKEVHEVEQKCERKQKKIRNYFRPNSP